MAPYTITAQPDTDIWRKSDRNAFNAPSVMDKENTQLPLKKFESASITFSFPSGLVQQFDQGGLLLHITRPGLPCHSANMNEQQQHDTHRDCKWLKTGIEYFNGVPHLSTVCCDRYADWSVVPLSAKGDQLGSTTIEVKRDGETTMWVYHVQGGERKPLREIAWVFADQEDPAWVVSVGGMGARPGQGEQGGLSVDIEQLDVTWR